MEIVPHIIRAVHALTPDQMLFVVTVVALLTVGGIAITALKGGRTDDRA